MKTLPLLPPNTKLRLLDVENCSIAKIPDSYIRSGIMLNLKNNQLRELPREQFQQFLEKGGSLKYDLFWSKEGKIAVDFNPLEYPPDYILERGEEGVLSYLKSYANTTFDATDTPVILIGNSKVGKTSLGLLLAGKISSAKEVKIEDRTEALDIYPALIGLVKVNSGCSVFQ